MMDKTYKILMVHNYYQIPGGEDTVVAGEKKLLEENGHKVILYTRHNSELKTMPLWRKLLLPVTMIYNPGTARAVRRIIRDEEIDIVHVHNTLSLVSPSVYYAARACGVPVVQTVHNFRLLCPGATFYRDGHICEDCLHHGLGCALKHKCYRNSRLQTLACVLSSCVHRLAGIYRDIHYICLTDFNRNKLLVANKAGKKPLFDPEKVYVKPNFVAGGGAFIPEAQRKNQFLFAGRLDRLKGIDLLLEAWRRLGPEAPKLIVCGSGPMEDWCRAFLKANPVNVELRGQTPNGEVRALMGESRALILPTRCYEGFPMSMVEAFSVGTPVICPDLGNSGSLVREGVSGCKFRSDCLESLLDAVGRCRGMCASTLEYCRENYTESMNYQRLMEIYSNLLN